jgi:hypothetical protein
LRLDFSRRALGIADSDCTPCFFKKEITMTTLRQFIPLTLLAATLCATLPLASAAPGAPPCGPMSMHDMYFESNSERMAQHHSRLHDALALKAEQEPAWKKMIESEGQMGKLAPTRREDWAKLTTPERAERRLEWMKASQLRMEEHIVSLKAFYEQLSSEQKKTFDEFHAKGKPGGRHGKPVPSA